MTVYDPPKHLINLKARWYAAQALVERVSAEEPAGDLEVSVSPRSSGEQPCTIRQTSDEQAARFWDAQETLRALTLELFQDPWKQSQHDPANGRSVHDAEKALNAAALERYEATLKTPAARQA